MRRSFGFTLIEVIIAIAIFALIGIGCYSILHGLLVARSSVNQKTEDMMALSMAMNTIDADLTQITSRRIIGVDDKVLPAVLMQKTNKILEFSRVGSRNSKMDLRSEVIRVQYELVSDSDIEKMGISTSEGAGQFDDESLYLVRKVWPVLDRASDDDDLPAKIILPGVSDFDVEFYNEKAKWVKEWPPEPIQTTASNQDRLYALKVRIVSQHYGTIERIVSITDLKKPQD